MIKKSSTEELTPVEMDSELDINKNMRKEK